MLLRTVGGCTFQPNHCILTDEVPQPLRQPFQPRSYPHNYCMISLDPMYLQFLYRYSLQYRTYQYLTYEIV